MAHASLTWTVVAAAHVDGRTDGVMVSCLSVYLLFVLSAFERCGGHSSWRWNWFRPQTLFKC